MNTFKFFFFLGFQKVPERAGSTLDSLQTVLVSTHWNALITKGQSTETERQAVWKGCTLHTSQEPDCQG
jgi:hypothetical protein